MDEPLILYQNQVKIFKFILIELDRIRNRRFYPSCPTIVLQWVKNSEKRKKNIPDIL